MKFLLRSFRFLETGGRKDYYLGTGRDINQIWKLNSLVLPKSINTKQKDAIKIEILAICKLTKTKRSKQQQVPETENSQSKEANKFKKQVPKSKPSNLDKSMCIL